MTVLTLIMVAAAVALTVARRWRLPTIPLMVIAGVALHATGLLVDDAMITSGLELGLTFLVFVMGTELSPARVGKQRQAALRVGLFQFIVVGAICFMVVRLMGFGWLTALYLALAMTASSTLVVVSILRQRQQFFEPFGRLVLGVLLLQDLLIIFAIAGLSRASAGPGAMVMAMVTTLTMMLFAYVLVRWIMPYLLVKLNLDEEGLLLGVLTILFCFVGLAHALELPWVVGAFLAGVSLSGFPTQGVVRGQLTSLSDFFSAIFFVSLGAVLTLPDLREMMLAVVLTLLVLLSTPLLVTIIGRRIGMTARSSIESGLLIAQCSELSIILGLIAQSQGYLDDRMLGVVALVTVVTMIVTPFIATDRMTWRIMRWQLPGTQRKLKPLPHTAHLVMVGCGTNGMNLLNLLIARGQTVVVIDGDAGVVDRLQSRDIPAVRGDGADLEVLEAVNASAARAIVSNMRRLDDNLRLLDFARGAKVFVRVFDSGSGQRIEAAGGIAIEEAGAATDEFMQWFDKSADDAEQQPAPAMPA